MYIVKIIDKIIFVRCQPPCKSLGPLNFSQTIPKHQVGTEKGQGDPDY